MAMNLIGFLLAFRLQVCLFFFGSKPSPYLNIISLAHSILIQQLLMSYFSLDLREYRGSFLSLIKGRYPESVAHITLSSET